MDDLNSHILYQDLCHRLKSSSSRVSISFFLSCSQTQIYPWMVLLNAKIVRWITKDVQLSCFYFCMNGISHDIMILTYFCFLKPTFTSVEMSIQSFFHIMRRLEFIMYQMMVVDLDTSF